jgi:hypothetical protein
MLNSLSNAGAYNIVDDCLGELRAPSTPPQVRLQPDIDKPENAHSPKRFSKSTGDRWHSRQTRSRARTHKSSLIATRCPICADSGPNSASQRNDAKCQEPTLNTDRISEAQSGFTRNPSERSAFVRKLRAHDRRRCRTRTPRNLSSGQASRGPVGSAAPRSDGQSNAWPMTAGKTSMAGTSPAMTISRRGVDQGTAGQATSWT